MNKDYMDISEVNIMQCYGKYVVVFKYTGIKKEMSTTSVVKS